MSAEQTTDVVSAWLDDDEALRIPDTEWGRALYAELRGMHDELKSLRFAVAATSRLLAAYVPEKPLRQRAERATPVPRCPACGHAPHGPACYNLASDNDCACTRDNTPAPTEEADRG